MQSRPISTRWQIAALTLSRFLFTTAGRIIFPFLPAFARGLNVSIEDIQRLTAASSVSGFVAPILIPFSERFGRRLFLIAGFIFFIIGCTVVYLFPTYWMFGASMILVALGQALYDPIMRTHLSEVVPWEQRGRAMAVTETAWASALLIGAPIAGWLIGRYGWRSPFLLLALFGIVALFVIGRVIPETRSESNTQFVFRDVLLELRTNRQLLIASVYLTCIMSASMMVFATYADWLEQRFAISLSGLGVAAMVLGSADLIGELSTGWLGDAIGKRRMVLITSGIAFPIYAITPSIAQTPLLAYVMLFLLFLTFESSFIAVLPIFSELVPHARSIAFAVLSLVPPVARAVILMITPNIYDAGGFALINWVAAGLFLIAFLVFWRSNIQKQG